MAKCGVCDKWFMTGDNMVLIDEKNVHQECSGMNVAKTTPTKSPAKMSFQDLLTQHGERGYEYEMSKDLLHTRVSTQFPTLVSVKRNVELESQEEMREMELGIKEGKV